MDECKPLVPGQAVRKPYVFRAMSLTDATAKCAEVPGASPWESADGRAWQMLLATLPRSTVFESVPTGRRPGTWDLGFQQLQPSGARGCDVLLGATVTAMVVSTAKATSSSGSAKDTPRYFS